MAGHSKWANIQHRKGRQDAVRSKLFSKISTVFFVICNLLSPLLREHFLMPSMQH